MPAQMSGEVILSGISVLIGIGVTLTGFRVFGKKPEVGEETDRWHAKFGKWFKFIGPVIVLGGIASFILATKTGWPRASDGWSRHTTTDGACSIEFPGAPALETQSARDGAGESLALADITRNAHWSLTFSDFSAEDAALPSEEQFDLLRAQFSMTQTRDGIEPRLIKEQVLVENGFPGREYYVAIGHQLVTRVKVFINGARVYRAIAVNPPNAELDRDSQRFINSFRFEITKP